VDAFKRLPASLSVELEIRAIGKESGADHYRDRVERAARVDPRIRFLPPVPRQQVGAFMCSIDALVVPSQWMETGPLVVLEAFAARTPVIGSDLGGIKELVSHENDGLLVPHNDVSAWTAALLRVANDCALLLRLRQGIRPVRTISDVAHDMATMYRELLAIDANAA